ncbi:MAG: c-type cytochrome [Cytophagaceae bacterium]|nr:c-type cytochrome [Cytophagaceae bacterium]
MRKRLERSQWIITGLGMMVMLLSIASVWAPSDTPYYLNLPPGFPEPVIPAGNEFTQERVALGKKLFYDTRLSSNGKLSCASCHNPIHSFTDTARVSMGVDNKSGTRNSMPLVNLAWASSFFWDGGVPTLEMQIRKPLTSHVEMNRDVAALMRDLQADAEYKSLFKKAYGSLNEENLYKAIACFERTLVSGNSRFDFYFYYKQPVFSESEERGYKLFFDGNYKLHCASCHGGFNFTNQSFQNNGLYESYADQGRYLITNLERDKGKFKVPSLRNVELTAPYMHDGSLKTLEEVVEHYASGGKNHPNKSPHVHIHQAYQLTEQDKVDLVNFLKTLTDRDFIYKREHRPE